MELEGGVVADNQMVDRNYNVKPTRLAWGAEIKKEEVKYLLAPAVTVHNVTALEMPVHQFSLLFGAES